MGTGASERRTMYLTHYPPVCSNYVERGQAFNDLVRIALSRHQPPELGDMCGRQLLQARHTQ